MSSGLFLVVDAINAIGAAALVAAADLTVAASAATSASAASATAASGGGMTTGVGGSGLGGAGGPDRSSEGQAGISDGSLRPKIKSTTVSGANPGGYPDLIAALRSLGGRT